MLRSASAAFAVLAALAAPVALADRPAPDPWHPLAFLEGTWAANTKAGGAVTAAGTYTFVRELGGHVLARHGALAGCTATPGADCEHGDLLYIYEEPAGQPKKALYLDNEGHVIHYDVTVPTSTSAIFLSEPGPGPRFRLVYERTGATMSGKFQMQPLGATEWKSYLEWTGAKK